MKLVNGNSTFFTSNDVSDKEEFFRQMNILLRGDKPSYIWVDNYTEAYRFWNFSVLLTKNGKISSDAYFDMGSYSLTLSRGSVINGIDLGFNIEGTFVFRRAGYTYEGKKLALDNNGKFIFSCPISSPDELNMGICYFYPHYDGFTQRTILASVRSPFIKMDKTCEITVNFYPFVKNECKAFFKDTVALESFYTTIYGDKISFVLDKKFYFVLEQSYSSAEGHDYYFTPAGEVQAKAQSSKESIEFMPGLSGSEYIRVKKEFKINFVPGQQALFEEFNDIEKKQYPLTSYLGFPEGDYFSQPRRGGFYRQEGKVYDFTELIPVSLKETLIPSFAYSGAENTDESIVFLENDHISPLRHEIIENIFNDAKKFADDAGENNLAALVDYRDPIHQYYDNFRDYAFKVLMIQIRITNNKVESFQCKAELLINKFFGGRAISHNSESGNNLIFNGTYQKDESSGHYNFIMDSPVSYSVSGSGITEIAITDGALRTDASSSRFVLDGTAKLYFIEECDIFSYDALKYSGFSVEMFQKGLEYAFKSNIEAMTLNTSLSKLRDTSFAAKFPVLPITIQMFKAKTPKDSGYTALQIKGVVPEKMDEESYGILWEVKMGNLGDLAAKINMTLELVTAWSPTPEREKQDYTGNFSASKPKIFAGIRFSAAGGSDDWNLPLQGILRLGFDSIDLTKMEKEGAVTYFFRFRNFGITIFEIRFPFTNNDMYLISNAKKSLGWYGSAGK